MIRKQFFIDEDQNRDLKALATSTGKSEAELIRQSIERELEEAKRTGASNDWKTAWLHAAGIWSDYPEIDEKITRGRKSWATRHDRLFSRRGKS